MAYRKGVDTEQYCPQCDAVRSVVRTVAWQPNQCRECGTEIPSGENAQSATHE